MSVLNPMRPRIEELAESCPLDLGITPWTVVSRREADAFDRLVSARVDFTVHPGGPRRSHPVNPLHVLALLSGFSAQLGVPGIESTDHVTMLNYGFDDVVWHQPVLSERRLRDRVKLLRVTERQPGEFLIVQGHEIEVEGQTGPALTAVSPGLAILL